MGVTRRSVVSRAGIQWVQFSTVLTACTMQHKSVQHRAQGPGSGVQGLQLCMHSYSESVLNVRAQCTYTFSVLSVRAQCPYCTLSLCLVRTFLTRSPHRVTIFASHAPSAFSSLSSWGREERDRERERARARERESECSRGKKES